jgi:hypothetical protein
MKSIAGFFSIVSTFIFTVAAVGIFEVVVIYIILTIIAAPLSAFTLTICIFCVTLSGGVWLRHLYVEKKYKEERKKMIQQYEKYNQEWRKQGEEQTRCEDHLSFLVSGPEFFCKVIYQVLNELKEHAPHRYREAIHFLPKAEYDPTLQAFHGRIRGRSNGKFCFSEGQRYKNVRHVFLHEVGHCVCIARNNDSSEEAAQAYARRVKEELKNDHSR